MYRNEGIKKDVLLSKLMYHLLETYAPGFKYQDQDDDLSTELNFSGQHKGSPINEYQASYFLGCSSDPLYRQITKKPRLALLIKDSQGLIPEDQGKIRCRAGGLSVSMLSEMILVIYYKFFAEHYDDISPSSYSEFQARLENMKDWVQRMVQKDATIRSVPRSMNYFGYIRLGPISKQAQASIASGIQDLISEDDHQFPLDCFGMVSDDIQSNPLPYYRLMEHYSDNADPSVMEKFLMLDNLYQDNDRVDRINWPQELYPPKTEIPLIGEEGWFCFEETLHMKNRILLLPSEEANKHSPITLFSGYYVLVWHQSSSGVDVIALIQKGSNIQKNPKFSSEGPMPLIQNPLKKISGGWRKSIDRLVVNRQRIKDTNWIAAVLQGYDISKYETCKDCILRDSNNVCIGFLLSGLERKDFMIYRHYEKNQLIPDAIYCTCNKEQIADMEKSEKKRQSKARKEAKSKI